ncbi:MAG TPA: RsiV family protein [Luteimonas sp.]|nr:RsiV family protein [Luteimonas sp.]HRO26263.1 RsiV family protein [Luteimonas sp.]HRP71027.1 RsiV family protein [Luteimonas sp.]
MNRVLLAILVLLVLSACRREAPQAQPGSPADGQAGVDLVEPSPEVVELKDVVETDPRYIIGITYPPAVNRYPGLARELKAYSDAARAELMEAVQGLDEEAGSTLYDLSLEYRIVADTAQVFAVAADGGSYTGGAHGAPLIARFVWLPQQDRRLLATDLVPDPRAWRDVSAYVREQLHAALSQRIDADDFEPGERERMIRSAGKMIDEGTAPDAEHFAEFEPVIGSDGLVVALRFVFPPYQVGPYSDGVQTVEVPARVLLPHVAQEYRPLFSAAAATR